MKTRLNNKMNTRFTCYVESKLNLNDGLPCGILKAEARRILKALLAMALRSERGAGRRLLEPAAA